MSDKEISIVLKLAADKLANAGITQPRCEASSLLSYVLGRDRSFLIAHPEYELTEFENDRFFSAVERRSDREPFHLILGEKEFFGLGFSVERGVLIPRSETEILVERALDLLGDIESPRILDLGTGTGCISISILDSVKDAHATAVDISSQALKLAKRNAIRHSVLDRLDLIRSDLFSKVSGKFDLITANPPYIPVDEAASLQPEVIDFDPPEALFSGPDGLDVIRRIVADALLHLRAGGYVLLEIGIGQAESVKQLFAGHEWSNVIVHNDLQDIPRIIEAHARRSSRES